MNANLLKISEKWGYCGKVYEYLFAYGTAIQHLYRLVEPYIYTIYKI